MANAKIISKFYNKRDDLELEKIEGSDSAPLPISGKVQLDSADKLVDPQGQPLIAPLVKTVELTADGDYSLFSFGETFVGNSIRVEINGQKDEIIINAESETSFVAFTRFGLFTIAECTLNVLGRISSISFEEVDRGAKGIFTYSPVVGIQVEI